MEEIRARLDFIGVDWVDEDTGAGSVRLLDYACGTGVGECFLGRLGAEVLLYLRYQGVRETAQSSMP